MTITNYFDDDGKTLQDILEQFFINYCLNES